MAKTAHATSYSEKLNRCYLTN